MILCPGFIDIHSHSDLTWLAHPRCEAKIMQGVTTEVLGQDGLAAAPVKKNHIPLLRRLVTGLLGDPGLEWDWVSIADYLSRFSRVRVSVNIASLVPHGNLRLWAMGMRKRKPTPRELDEMKNLLSLSMNEGACGLSTGLIYAPCSYSTRNELMELCTVVSKQGGYFAIHMRDEADQVLESMHEVIRIGEKTQVPVHINHLKAAGKSNWGKVPHILHLAEQARAKGVELTFEQYPYTAGSTALWALLPPWALEGGFEKTLARLKDPALRERMKKEVREGTAEWSSPVKEAGWDNTIISSLTSKKNRHFLGKSVSSIAASLKKTPEDVLFDLLNEERGAVSIILFIMSEENVRTIMAHPLQMFCTDGLLPPGKPHPRAYGTYPRVLGRYVRKSHDLSIEEAIRKMTSYPAQRLRLADRGIIRVGAWADLVIFDPTTIIDTATYAKPARYPQGIRYVIVNGQVTVEKSHHTGRRSGQVLRFCNQRTRHP